MPPHLPYGWRAGPPIGNASPPRTPSSAPTRSGGATGSMMQAPEWGVVSPGCRGRSDLQAPQRHVVWMRLGRVPLGYAIGVRGRMPRRHESLKLRATLSYARLLAERKGGSTSA